MGSSAEINFRLRVSPRDLPELMDGDCSFEDFRDCLRSLVGEESIVSCRAHAA